MPGVQGFAQVPLEFRPELVMIWLIVGLAAIVITATVSLLFGYVFSAWKAAGS